MRKPDLVIGPPDNPYMLRWHLVRFLGWQLALHKICRSDDDRALHDHRADNLSVILKGRYAEVVFARKVKCGVSFAVFGQYNVLRRRRFVPYFRKAETAHRIVVVEPTWSLWLRWPPRREWGYWCGPGKWRHWREFCAEDYNAAGVSTVGRGCD